MMKILFVCRANIGRSQIAHAYFSTLSKHESFSAGTGVDDSLRRFKPPSNLVKDASGAGESPAKPRGAHLVIAYAKEFGADISRNERRQLTPEMVDAVDRVIVITERDTWPDYLKNSDEVTFWDIPDAVGLEPDRAHKIFDCVRRRVDDLVAEIG